MPWSLDISTGDLALSGPGGFAVVRGTQKLLQDLRSALLTQAGSDPHHQAYGSVLDGGVLPDGTVVDTTIGNMTSPGTLVAIETEIRRILTTYQQNQLALIKAQQIQFGGQTGYDPSEVLLAVDSVTVDQIRDTVVAFVSIRTAAGQKISFAQAVGTV